MYGKVVWFDPQNSELIKVKVDGRYIALIEFLGHKVEMDGIMQLNRKIGSNKT